MQIYWDTPSLQKKKKKLKKIKRKRIHLSMLGGQAHLCRYIRCDSIALQFIFCLPQT